MDSNYVVLRIDGKNFSRYTRNFKKDAGNEYSDEIGSAMLAAALGLLDEIDDAYAAYVVSDEISLLLHDRGENSWYGGREQKLISVSSSIATAYFNRKLNGRTPAFFDSRVIVLDDEPDTLRVYLTDRRANGFSNAVSSYARAEFGHKILLGVDTDKRYLMLKEAGVTVDKRLSFGTILYKEKYVADAQYTDKRTGEVNIVHDVERTRISEILFEYSAALNKVLQ